MKKIIFLLFVLGCNTSLLAQNDYKKQPAFGIHFFFNDFKTAADIRDRGLNTVLKENNWSDIDRMDPGLAVSYINGVSNYLDFAATLSGSFTNYPIPDKPISSGQDLLLELAAAANLKLLSDKHFFSPFLTLGAGASKYKGYYGAFIPAGVGLQFNLKNEAFILINSQYRMPVTSNVAYHFYHSIGIAGNLFERKTETAKPLPPMPVIAPVDTDGDGVVDSLDNCPDVAGLAALMGCPDSDRDGIADKDDKCPDAAGTAKYNGCPVPDTDKDGVNDDEDQCINEPGVARYRGCPVPDSDGDGVNDEEDKCPKQAGSATNFGCPEIAKAVVDKIKFAAGKIYFATGSAKLLAKSNKSLDEVAKIMKDDPSLNMDIEGHTDNTGKEDKNQVLSEERAASVKAYLISKGVDESRLASAGFGQNKPIADNKTADGRSKNRRVEMKVRNY